MARLAGAGVSVYLHEKAEGVWKLVEIDVEHGRQVVEPGILHVASVVDVRLGLVHSHHLLLSGGLLVRLLLLLLLHEVQLRW